MNRRFLLSGVSLVLLSACAGGGNSNQPVTVDLTTAQLWAREVTDALAGFANELVASGDQLSEQTKGTVITALRLLQAAEGTFQQVQPGASVHDLATQVLTGISRLLGQISPYLPVLNAGGPVGMGIQLGLMVLTAFVNSLPVVVPPVPAALHRAALTYRGRR